MRIDSDHIRPGDRKCFPEHEDEGDREQLLVIFFVRAVESPTFCFGTALLIVSFIFFATALSWADLSFVVPAVSAEVVVNVVFANYFLNEVVSLTRWTGVLFISIGVILVLRSERQRVRLENKEILTRVER